MSPLVVSFDAAVDDADHAAGALHDNGDVVERSILG